MRNKTISLFRRYAALENEAYDRMVEGGFQPAQIVVWERRVNQCERYAYLRGLLNEEGQRHFESRIRREEK